MTDTGPSEDRRALIIMDYEKLHEYYLWSLNTRSSRVTLYVQVFAAAIAACCAVLVSSVEHKYAACGGIMAVFLVIGGLMVDRVVSGQITGMWCVFRLNALRRIIRDTWNMGDVFRPLPMSSLRPKPLLRGLLKYRTKASSVPIIGNAVAAGAAVFFWFMPLSVIAAIATGVCCGCGAWLFQMWYVTRKIAPLDEYVVYANQEYEQEVVWMKQVSKGEHVMKEDSSISDTPETGDHAGDVIGKKDQDASWEVLKDGRDLLDKEEALKKRAEDGFCFICEND